MGTQVKICNKCRYVPFPSENTIFYFWQLFPMCLLVHFYTSPHPAPALPLQPSIMLHSFLLQVLGYYPASSFKKLSEQEGTCFLWSFVINSQLTCFLPVLRLGKVQSCGFYTSPISSSYWHYQSLTILFFFFWEWCDAFTCKDFYHFYSKLLCVWERHNSVPVSHGDVPISSSFYLFQRRWRLENASPVWSLLFWVVLLLFKIDGFFFLLAWQSLF